MKSFVRNRVSNVALFAGVLAAAWSPASFACSDTPVLASICVMAVPLTFGPFNRQYVLAAGQDLSINNYTALYSLIGTTYGQTNNVTFKLPDLRGRFVIAADGVNYNTGDKGGKSAITLTTDQLPPHLFTVTALPVALSGVSVATVLPTLSGTVNIASSVVTGTVSDLKLNVVGSSGGVTSPSGNYLGKSTSPLVNVYSSATPDATLNAGAISGGKVSVTLPSSTATASVPGGAVAAGTLGGTATVSGKTNSVGTGAAIDIRPPYIALTYYIAAQNALYPSRD
ncbi:MULTISPECIES: tail fiber protein [unclassified Janthinobacterium]|uniref:phage tail protein n=1 Tax=unclassified Janthinobacterium TaxID=2610881 RepID=UPI001A1FADF9|nr:tail fiber protein [Janthinobacterium sp. CG_23.4]MDH6158274.1 microcystin-dependent protein [Janthinobacterium sp. CG_23.4]